MAWLEYLWTPEAEKKLAEHGLTTDDFEHVMASNNRFVKSKTSDRLIRRGQTEAGDWIVCVYEEIDDITVMPITAYKPTKGPR